MNSSNASAARRSMSADEVPAQPSGAAAVAGSVRTDSTRTGVSFLQALACAAPAAGINFYYMPMWSILPGIYAKYYGLSMTVIAAAVLFSRVFDGAIDTMVGYLSDRHRANGGSRKTWVAVGSIGSIITCYFLFMPPAHVSVAYYIGWSLAYFLAFTVAVIPHTTWGSELTVNYQRRAQIFGLRNVMANVGVLAFYAMPLLPIYGSTDYTPKVLEDAVYVGALLTLMGLCWALLSAPAGIAIQTMRDDSVRMFLRSLLHNKPLLLYLAAFTLTGLCYGMWFGLLYFYLDGHLGLGARIAFMFLAGTIVSMVSTPVWLALIRRTSKSAVWATGVVLFGLQLLATWFVEPGDQWVVALTLVILAHLCFTCHDVAALSILGDVVDYGKLKFNQDRGGTYFGFNTLIFKISLGVGGSLAIAIAGQFGFDPSAPTQAAAAIDGLKIGFVLMPASLAFLGLLFIRRTPIDRRRHKIIQRRIESRLVRDTT